MNILEKVPTVLSVGVLVVIFVCLMRHARSARLHLWMMGWCMVFTHFAMQLFEPSSGAVSPVLFAIDGGALQASAVMFLAALATGIETSLSRRFILAGAGAPAVAFIVLDSFDLQARWPFVFCLLGCLAAGVLLCLLEERRPSIPSICIGMLCLGIGMWAIRGAMHGSHEEGITALLGIGFALPGFLLCRNHWRDTPGMFTIAGGFFAWGAVFPVAMLMEHLFPKVNVPAELWNVPKLFVAFGMILAIVEDKSESIAKLQQKEHSLNCQMERFSAITSRLLGGASVDSLCEEIARAITEVSNFQIAAISLDNAGHNLRVAGASGLTPGALLELRQKCEHWSIQDIQDFCRHGRRIGQSSFLLSNEQAAKYAPVKSRRQYDENPYWATGDELLIPLCSARGVFLGCIALDDPRRVEEVNERELARIELLAADLAVALELKSLHAQLVRSEKLAALGQLVAGVAHELNNPLTVVMGFGELLLEEVPAENSRDRLNKLVNEARRMKRIVDNLLRFSRQNTVDRQPVSLAPVLQDVLALREYHAKALNVDIAVEIDSSMRLLVDEDEIKQILLNLLNNAIDAVELAREGKNIAVRAYRNGNKGIIEVDDNGPGFADLNKAMDPFYTTKEVGQGTGLGLSICYGIIKEHGGEIRLHNLQPQGARVAIELPLADPQDCSAAAAAFAGA
jgi:two-component system, NtrC family, sensor kinase